MCWKLHNTHIHTYSSVVRLRKITQIQGCVKWKSESKKSFNNFKNLYYIFAKKIFSIHSSVWISLLSRLLFSSVHIYCEIFKLTLPLIVPCASFKCFAECKYENVITAINEQKKFERSIIRKKTFFVHLFVVCWNVRNFFFLFHSYTKRENPCEKKQMWIAYNDCGYYTTDD